jgi:hypothetical protein
MQEYNDFMTPMFSIPILHLQVRDWENKKKKLMKIHSYIKSNSKACLPLDVDTDYHYNANTQNSYDLEVESILEEELSIVENEFNCGVIMGNCWFETAQKHSFHRVHNHGSKGLSSVCYLEYDNRYHKPTHFVSPLLYSNEGNDTYIPSNDDVGEGSILFWPSAIMHYTEPHLSDVPRIVLSFNLECQYHIFFDDKINENEKNTCETN